jgi:sugar-specific transcriptional regulator TrmB
VESAHALTYFGFTALEAEIYAFLLTESPASGYRIAQAIHKPAANTYKALQTLEYKGAVASEDGTTKLFAPTPKAELISRLTRDFERRRKDLVELLPEGRPATPASAPTILLGPNVMDRAIAMVDEAQRQIIGTAGGSLHTAIAAPLGAATQREVDVAVVLSRRDTIVLIIDGAAALIGNSSRATWTTDGVVVQSLIPLTASHVGFAEVAEREDVGAKRLQRIVARVEELGG